MWSILRTVLVVLLSVLIAQASFAIVADFDLNRVNYPDPTIVVTYNEPVIMLEESSSLLFLDTSFPSDIPILFTGNGQQYSATYDIEPSAGELGLGQYLLSVVARNSLGLTTPTPGTVTFIVTGLEMKLVAPNAGFSPITPYDVAISTFVRDEEGEHIPFNAECKYRLDNAPLVDDFTDPLWRPLIAGNKSTDADQSQRAGLGTVHTAPDIQTTRSPFSVICQQYKKDGTLVPKPVVAEFTVGVLTEPPNITVSLAPEELVNENRPIILVYAETDQEATCTLSHEGTSVVLTENFSNTHTYTLRYDTDEGIHTDYTGNYELHHEDYVFECTNRAGLSTQENITTIIDFGASLQISVQEPSALTNANPVISRIQTNFNAVCTVNGDAMTSTGLVHSAQHTTEPDATYTNIYSCVFEDKLAEVNFTFRTDRISPIINSLNSSGLICDGEASVIVNGTDNDLLHKYFWTLSDGENIIASGESTNGILSTPVAPATQQYTWSVTPQDYVGNNGTAATHSFVAAPGNSDECDPTPFIRYKEPALGWDTRPFTPTIETKREATCYYVLDLIGADMYANNQTADSDDNLLHELPRIDGGSRQYKIACAEPERIHEKTLSFGIVGDFLIEDVKSTPEPVTDYQEPMTAVSVTTNNDAVCTIVGPSTNTPFFGEDISDPETYTRTHTLDLDLSFVTAPETFVLDFEVVCKDRAGQTASTSLPITASFDDIFPIEVISPPEYTSSSEITLIIKPSLPAVCEYREPDSNIDGQYSSLTASGDQHTQYLGEFSGGAHSVVVRCTNAESQTATRTVQFTVDSTPSQFVLTGNPEVCSDASTTILFETNDTFANKTIMISRGGTTIFSQVVTSDRYEIQASTLGSGTFTITGLGVDNAGNEFSTEYEITVIEESSCQPTLAIICGNGLREPPEQCDGFDLGTDTSCSSHNPGTSGTITTCTPSCRYDLSRCTIGNDDFIVDPTDIDDDFDPFAEVEKPFPWLALILTLLGLLLMGGASYYLYDAYNSRTPPASPQSPPGQPLPPPMSRENTITRLQQQQQENFQKKAEEHSEQRRNLTSAFSENGEAETQKPSPKKTKPEKSVFDDLDEFIEK